MSFISKYYKPWSVPWIFQRFLLVIKNGSLFKISWKTLLMDYRSSRKISESLKKRPINSDDPVKSTNEVSLNEVHERVVTCLDMDYNALSSLNKFFDHIYVVNLARRADRRREMINKLTKLKIKAEFFPAEDGTSEENFHEFNNYMNTPIDPENAHELEIKLKRKVIYSPGAWGTLKSYRKILKEAGERGYDKILCLEDDTIFAKNFEELFIQAAKIIPDNWKIIYLGASQHSWEESVDLIHPPVKFDENTAVKYYLPLTADGAFAIGIRNPAFSHLIAEIEKMNCAFDSGALRSAARTFQNECFVVDPNLIIADVRESDIRIGRKQSDFAEIARWNLDLYDFDQ